MFESGGLMLSACTWKNPQKWRCVPLKFTIIISIFHHRSRLKDSTTGELFHHQGRCKLVRHLARIAGHQNGVRTAKCPRLASASTANIKWRWSRKLSATGLIDNKHPPKEESNVVQWCYLDGSILFLDPSFLWTSTGHGSSPSQPSLPSLDWASHSG